MRYERGSRVRSGLPARVRIGDTDHDAILIDFSRKGARLRGVSGAAKNDAVSVEVLEAGDAIRGTVAWCKDGELGVTFAAALPEPVAQRLLVLTGERDASA